MIWPPVKAWTSKEGIYSKVHFVAINYGLKHRKKWVVLMSVTDSNVVIKVPWSQMLDSLKWVPGWDNKNYIASSKSVDEVYVKSNELHHPSVDSGLTVPITLDPIRPWFEDS